MPIEFVCEMCLENDTCNDNHCCDSCIDAEIREEERYSRQLALDLRE